MDIKSALRCSDFTEMGGAEECETNVSINEGGFANTPEIGNSSSVDC
jgi:hypothetical protein